MSRIPQVRTFFAGLVVGIGVTSLTIATAQDRGSDSGPEPPCPADIAPNGGDNVVDVQDLLAVINQWGSCPCAGGCNDGDPCTIDQCIDGKCQHTPFGCCVNGCPPVPHAFVQCVNNQCVIAGCHQGWLDCDGEYENGCEWPSGICP